MELIHSNPMRKTTLPRKKDVETFPNFYTKQQLETFFDCLNDHISSSGRTSTKLLAFFRILAFTGLRKSEVLALQWSDIDLFNQEPKTISSKRVIKLDVQTIKIIRAWRINQQKWYLKLGYNTANEEQFLFTNKFNKLYYPQAPNDWLYNIFEKYQLPKITLHGFRHTRKLII